VFENVANGFAGTPLADLPQPEKLERVREACKSSFADEFIQELPEGYDTKIGERGTMLSGGQKQSLVIARSIVSNPSVLLLDEATSALDPRAEAIVQKALDNVAGNRTMVVIAHRLSTVRNADNIVVMDHGEILEQGIHEELVESGGAYSRLVHAQNLGQSEEDDEDGDNKVEDEGQGNGVVPTKTTSAVQVGNGDDQGANVARKDKLSLLHCLAIVTKEQRCVWGWLVIVGLACCVCGATYPGLAIIFARTMEAFTLPGPEMTRHGDFYSLMFFVIALGNLVAYGLIGWFMNKVAQTVLKNYRLEIFNNTIRQEMAFFDEPGNTTGALVSRLSTEPVYLQDLISFNVGLLLINVVNVVSSCILAIVYGWKLGITLVLAALPPLIFSGYLRIRLEYKFDDDTSGRFADSSGVASEAVLAIRTVVSLALERDIVEKYKDKLRSVDGKAVRSLGWKMFWYALSQSISFLAEALGFWYGGQLVSTGEYTSTQFYVVFIATIFSGEAAALFFQYTTSITKAQGAANYIFWLRSRVPACMAEHYETDDEKTDKGGVEISCQKLEFAYPQRPHAKVVKGVSIDIQPGQFVAFVGASGCGKTTMVSLLERFYEPTSGRILFDGVENAAIHPGKYRSDVALVQQEPVLYQGSIRDNIVIGKGDSACREMVADDDIFESCRQANIYDFVASLPEGLATRCGSQGLQLSGGQRQRIAIARALIRKPRLLLLDEATSSLDTESERVVQAALDAAAKRGAGDNERICTTVAVAHRLSTIKGADIIFVFSRGQIVECGSHEQLLEKRGLYYEMCLGQSLDRAVPMSGP